MDVNSKQQKSETKRQLKNLEKQVTDVLLEFDEGFAAFERYLNKLLEESTSALNKLC
jgi:hypothetical protein